MLVLCVASPFFFLGCSGRHGEGIDIKMEREACLEVFRRIDSAKHSYARAHALTNGVSLTERQIAELGEYMWGGWPSNKCPADGQCILGEIGEPPRCSRHAHWNESQAGPSESGPGLEARK